MMISVIIPTWNEEQRIGDLVKFLLTHSAAAECEVIVVDGGSTDQTILKANRAGALTAVIEKGRARQMNHGASLAKGDILFFLHADTRPPDCWSHDISKAVKEGYSAGCYRLAFDYNHWFLRLNGWFTRFNFTPFRFGDQGLFITRTLFQNLRGFDSRLLVMEDQEIVQRIKKIGKHRVFESAAVTSARKYRENGIFRLQFTFIVIYFLYKLGVPQSRLVKFYERFIRDNRIATRTTAESPG